MTDETYSVHDEEDFARVYDEDTMIEVRMGDLRAVLDIATMSMDFGSGFLDNEQVEALRKLATIINLDPMLATPSIFTCQYKGKHQWQLAPRQQYEWWCALCRHTSTADNPPGWVPT